MEKISFESLNKAFNINEIDYIYVDENEYKQSNEKIKPVNKLQKGNKNVLKSFGIRDDILKVSNNEEVVYEYQKKRINKSDDHLDVIVKMMLDEQDMIIKSFDMQQKDDKVNEQNLGQQRQDKEWDEKKALEKILKEIHSLRIKNIYYDENGMIRIRKTPYANKKKNKVKFSMNSKVSSGIIMNIIPKKSD